jgi:hypothetical protein
LPSKKLNSPIVRRRRDVLAAKLESAKLDSEKASAERRRLLIEVEAAPPGEIAAAESACRDAADRVSGFEDAVRSITQQIVDAEQSLSAQREQGERELAATECERRATTIDAAAGKLAQALAMVAGAYGDLRGAIHVGGITEPGHGIGLNYAAEIYAGSTLRCGLEGVLPDILSRLQSVGVVAGETADVTARRLQSDRLRRHADDLRCGRVPIALLPAPTDAAYRSTPRIERTQLVLAEPILYLDEHLAPVRVIAGGVELPVPVADKAVELGIGHPFDSAERGANPERDKVKTEFGVRRLARHRRQPSRLGRRRASA